MEGGGPRVVVSTAAFHARVRGSVPGLGGLKETKLFLPHPRVKVSIVGSLRDREVAYSASDRQGSNFESCVWRTVSSQSSHHPQEVLLAQFSLYVHKGGLKPDSFHFTTPVEQRGRVELRTPSRSGRGGSSLWKGGPTHLASGPTACLYLHKIKSVRYCVAIWVMDQIFFFLNYRQTFQCHQKIYNNIKSCVLLYWRKTRGKPLTASLC